MGEGRDAGRLRSSGLISEAGFSRSGQPQHAGAPLALPRVRAAPVPRRAVPEPPAPAQARTWRFCRTSVIFLIAPTVLCTSCRSYFSGRLRRRSISNVASCDPSGACFLAPPLARLFPPSLLLLLPPPPPRRCRSPRFPLAPPARTHMHAPPLQCRSPAGCSCLAHLRQLLARQLAVRLGPLDLARVALHLEVLVALGAAELEDLRRAAQTGKLCCLVRPTVRCRWPARPPARLPARPRPARAPWHRSAQR